MLFCISLLTVLRSKSAFVFMMMAGDEIPDGCSLHIYLLKDGEVSTFRHLNTNFSTF